MLKSLIIFAVFAFSTASIIKDTSKLPSVETLPLHSDVEIEQQLWGKWGGHVMDFLNLVDLEKVMDVVMQHFSDPDVLNFIDFVYGDEFKLIAAEFLSIEELKEVTDFLEAKGYNAKAVIDIVSSHLEVPTQKSTENPTGFGKGITDLVEDILPILPLDKFKELFKNKLQSDAEIAKLFETVTSEEFKGIARRLSENPKLLDIKKKFESYGFDFKRLRKMAEKIIAEYFDGLVGDKEVVN